MLNAKKNIILLTAFFLLLSRPSLGAQPASSDGNKGYIQKNEAGKTVSDKPLINLKLPKIPIHGPKEYIPFFNLDAFGTYSHPNKGDDVWGVIIDGSISPAMKYDDNLYIIPLYNGSYERQKFFLQTEEGGLSYNEVQHHDLSATAKYLVTKKAILSPTIFGGWDLNVETNDEHWGKGLYDYRELGSGCDFDYLVYDEHKSQLLLTNGAKWYFRHYPNYHSLISLATVTAPEKDEKDYNGVEMYTGWKYSNLKNMSINLKYYLLLKYFTDKKVIDADGVLENKKRQEYRNSIKADVLYAPVADKGFQYNCSAEFICNIGNQNFYDSRGTLTLTDDVFTPKYYDYLGFEVHPQISYIFKHNKRTNAIISGGYDFMMRSYLHRKAQEVNGAYTSKTEMDYEHIFTANIAIPFNKHISWVTRYDYTIDQSNMDFEQYYTYSYKMHRVLTGISIIY